MTLYLLIFFIIHTCIPQLFIFFLKYLISTYLLGRCSFSFNLFIIPIFKTLVAPKIHHLNFEDNPVQSGSYATVQCTVAAGDIPLKISWKFNNDTIGSLESITVVSVNRRSSTLSIEPVSYEHAGYYTCIGENKVGKTEIATMLNVNGLCL